MAHDPDYGVTKVASPANRFRDMDMVSFPAQPSEIMTAAQSAHIRSRP